MQTLPLPSVNIGGHHHTLYTLYNVHIAEWDVLTSAPYQKNDA